MKNILYTRDGVKLLITRRHILDVLEDQLIGIRGVVFRVNALSVDCSHSISSLLRVLTIAAVGLESITSATILPSLIARVLPSLLVGLAP